MNYTLLMKKLISYFMRGLVFIAPLGITILLIFNVFDWINDKLGATPYKGIGLVFFLICVVMLLVIIGYAGSSFIFNPLSKYIEGLIIKIPGIGFIYSSMKDLMNAFMGEERKFETPVLVRLSKDSPMLKPGFITQEEMTDIGLDGMVSVYMPHSYAFSGTVFIVEKEYITPVDVKSSDFMKFIVSGGVAGMEKNNEENKSEVK